MVVVRLTAKMPVGKKAAVWQEMHTSSVKDNIEISPARIQVLAKATPTLLASNFSQLLVAGCFNN